MKGQRRSVNDSHCRKSWPNCSASGDVVGKGTICTGKFPISSKAFISEQANGFGDGRSVMTKRRLSVTDEVKDVIF